MNRFLSIILMVAGAQASAETLITEHSAELIQRCQVKLTNASGSVQYNNVGQQITGLNWPQRKDKYKLTKQENRRVVHFPDTDLHTAMNITPYCLSLQLKSDLVFMSANDAAKFLLPDGEGGYWDVCAIQGDGLVGRGLYQEKIGEGPDGIPVYGEVEIRDTRAEPMLKLFVMRRQIVKESDGKERLNLSGGEEIADFAAIVPKGDYNWSYSKERRGIRVEIACKVTEKVVNNAR